MRGPKKLAEHELWQVIVQRFSLGKALGIGEALRCQAFCNSADFPWSAAAAKMQSLGRSLCSWDVEAGFLSEAV